MKTLCSTVASLVSDPLRSHDKDGPVAKAAEDTFYVHEYGGKDPMIGKFWFRNTSEEEFEAIVAALTARLRAFLDAEYWSCGVVEGTGLELVAAQAEAETPEGELWCDLVIFRHHRASRCVTMILNHAKVGGGDYLRLGTKLWSGQASDLVPLPKSRAVIAYCIARSALDVCAAVALGQGGKAVDIPAVRYRGSFACGGSGERVGRRFVAAVALCEQVSRCMGWRSFHVIFPVGMSKEGAGQVANAVGAARVRYVAGMTPADLFRELQRKWYWVPATGFYSTRVKGDQSSSKASAFARSLADVVCTIAAFKRHEGPDVTRALTDATGTTLEMKFYPIYVWGMVEDNDCHWGMTVQSSAFKPNWAADFSAEAYQI